MVEKTKLPLGETGTKQWDSPALLEVDTTSLMRGQIVRSLTVGGTALSKTKTFAPFKPWKHQIDAVLYVRKMIDDPNLFNGAGTTNLLIQHSTGSGKSMTLACLVHQLLLFRGRIGDGFHTVLVLVDRIQLNQQIGDTIVSFLNRNGCFQVACAVSVDDLSNKLSCISNQCDQQVVITTIQKMRALMENKVLLAKLKFKIQSLNSNSFCRLGIVTDEAHRSHGSSTRSELTRLFQGLGCKESNILYVGFSATPGQETLQLFAPAVNGFGIHQYLMQSAIDDGHVLNVLQNVQYIRLNIETSTPKGVLKLLQDKQLMRVLMDHASQNVRIKEYKAKFLLEHFYGLKTKCSFGKCMVVVRSRAEIVQYHTIITTILKRRGSRLRVYCEFSSNVESVDGIAINDKKLNASDVDLSNSDIIIVCDKLDTGYNDPDLVAMYLDRKVKGSKAVQLMSRLNRIRQLKRETLVIDFVNHPFFIAEDFAPFWSSQTALSDIAVKLRCSANVLLNVMGHSIWHQGVNDIVKAIISMNMDTYNMIFGGLKKYLDASTSKKMQHCCLPYSKLQQIFKLVSLVGTVKMIDKKWTQLIHDRVDARVSSFECIFHGNIDPNFLSTDLPEDSYCLLDGNNSICPKLKATSCDRASAIPICLATLELSS